MAYTPKSKMFGDVDEDKTRQSLTGEAPRSTPAPMGSTSPGTAAPAVKQAPQPPSSQNVVGTGFVNMDRLLGANQGIGSQVSKVGGGLVKSEGAAFDKANKAATEGAAKGTQSVSPTVQNSIDMIKAGRKISDEDMAAVKAALGADYTGPMSIDYGFGSGGAKTAAALTNAKATGNILAGMAGDKIQGGVAGYDPRQSAIDRALYGQDPSAVKARDDLKGSLKKEATRQDAGTEAFNKLVGNKQAAAGTARDSVRGQLQGIADNIIGAGQSELGRAQSLGGVGPAPTLGNFVGGPGDYRLSQVSQALNNPDLDVQSAGNWSYTNPNAGQMGPQIDLLSQFTDVPTAPTPEQYEAARKSNTVSGPDLEKMFNQMKAYEQYKKDHPEYVDALLQTRANESAQSKIKEALGLM